MSDKIRNMPELDHDRYLYSFGPVPKEWDKEKAQVFSVDAQWITNIAGVFQGSFYRIAKTDLNPPKPEPPETIELEINWQELYPEVTVRYGPGRDCDNEECAMLGLRHYDRNGNEYRLTHYLDARRDRMRRPINCNGTIATHAVFKLVRRAE